MELFLKAEVPALGDVETLEAQIQESQVTHMETIRCWIYLDLIAIKLLLLIAILPRLIDARTFP